ncbi:unnamed protein product [Gongylonema pulchrum]|uniref:Uncharacterized protein n=1 Tax=Gongylonema pulchrum TaxID=637853 RepID=A0A183DDI5_9BILA|nr:unnamed protein product [Gongylonema pulchrum]
MKHYAGVYQAVQRAERERGTKTPLVDDVDARQKSDELKEVKMDPVPSPQELATAEEKTEKTQPDEHLQ